MSRGERRWDFNSRFVIGKPGNPMMERWRVIQTPLFGIYVHFIYREDLDRTPHDHPWSFWSLVLRGGYTEEITPDAREGSTRTQLYRRRGRAHHFPLRSAHRIIEIDPGTVTLVLVGPKVRTWGFWDQGTWTDYRVALHLRPGEGNPTKRLRGA